ncbi:hypothetical protein CPB86DRAFT_744697 [Serendipita vermifera]|nr:hypothetical protein CPB86DRAFT_744697 [Serendipita vermifera]
MHLPISTILLCTITATLVNAQGTGDSAEDSSILGAVTKKLKSKRFGIPPPPSGLSRRATCPAGYYLNNQCQKCTPGYACPGNDARTQCTPGYYSSAAATTCSACPNGTYTDQSGTQNNCKNVQGGYRANADSAATGQTPCGVGNYSPGNTSTCSPCPAGNYCNSQTTTTPTQCVPGRYAPTTGYGQDCALCPQGTFNNIYGATSCCDCCSGWYNDQTSQTHCFNCPGQGSRLQGSPPRSTSRDQCTFSRTDYTTTCDQARNGGACPTTTNPSTPSNVSRRSSRSTARCPNPAEIRCPVSKDRALVGKRNDVGGLESFGIDPELGPYECIDVRSNLESCGGCVPEGETAGEDGGQDCTAIDHVSAVSCASGKCVVGQCQPGYQVSPGKNKCVKAHNTKRHGRHGL